MTKDHTLEQEERLERALQRLGSRNPICVTCGESNPHCLELHHVAGRKYHDDTMIQCRNCHRKLSDAQVDQPSPSTTGPDAQTNLVGRYLLGLADWLAILVERLREFGNYLIALADGPQEKSS